MQEEKIIKKDLQAVSWFTGLVETLEEGKEYKVEIKEIKKKRSLSANNYFWVLLDKLATKIRVSKTEIYKSYIKEIGGVSDIVCVKNEALEKLRQGWEHNGIGWQTETMPSKIAGCMNVVLYYGSSTYNTKQMSDLIEMLVQDCKENDIPTLSSQEITEIIKNEELNKKEN